MRFRVSLPTRCTGTSSSGSSLVGSRRSKPKANSSFSSMTWRPSSHSGKLPASMASHRSRRWKSGSLPEIFCASSQATEWTPRSGFQWNFTKREVPFASTSRKVWTPKPSIIRKLRGMARSDMTHMTMCIDSGMSEMKSQKVSWADAAWGISLSRLRLHGVDEVGELDRVLDEEDRHVVADEVEVALVRVELHGEAAHVAREVGRAARAGDGREAHEDRRLRAGSSRNERLGQLRQRLVDLEEAVGAGAAGMDDALGDALVVEVGDLLAKMEVLEQRRPAVAGLEGVLVIVDRQALVGGERAISREVGERRELVSLRVAAGCWPWRGGSRSRRSAGHGDSPRMPCIPARLPGNPGS